METSVNHLAKQGNALVDKAAEKAQELRNDADPIVKRAASQAQALGKQGFDAIGDMAGQARDAVFDASDSIVAYTKKNPVKALAIAAASGALLYAAIKVLVPQRD